MNLLFGIVLFILLLMFLGHLAGFIMGITWVCFKYAAPFILLYLAYKYFTNKHS